MDVELGSRSDVPPLDGSSHHDDLSQLVFDVRKSHQNEAQISQRPSVYPCHFPLLLHYQAVDLCKAIRSQSLLGRLFD